ncbi:PREDICTED: uncharacterized protein LOC105570367 [Vollenhovia emeryi]|uniref:uncharacterized protein LOC105570367 n=1 Tax=Vollenhovia emeryi TaxID=411798 RepID=UPI0005F391FB|nr:PREDICTED: uncharacterized protein LOC105570367 [Vollenhovia emeryi]
MLVLRFTLILCTVSGCWQPLSWTSLSKHIIYDSYRILLICLISAFTISQVMNIAFNIDNFSEISDNIYMTLTVFIATYKLVTMWITKRHVRMIINILTEEPFKPSESCEVMIRQKYDKIIKKYASWYYGLVQITVICIILNAVIMDFMNGNLTYKAWVPFEYKSSIIFYFVFTHQMIGMSITAAVNVACDNLVSGLLQEICCQLEILEYRLTKILHDQHFLRDCVRHHDRIYEYAYMVNRRFAKIIALQFAVSMLVVCANLYKLASIPTLMLNGGLVTLILYTACMLSQIFLYCWFGNELKLKSTGVANSIYNMEWHILDNKSKRDLLLIMKRSMIPIEFTSAVIITMNLESFVSLLKASYSAYNLLKRSHRQVVQIKHKVFVSALYIHIKAQMNLMKFTLMICALAGCWQPLMWTSLFKHIIYKAYAMFLISSLYIFLLSQFINIILNVGNSDEFTDALYMMLTILVAGYKQAYMWIDRKNVMIIINVLTEKPFAPYETHEVTIQEKFEQKIQNNTRRYLTIVMMSITSILTMSVSTDLMKRNLTYKAWIPFDYSSPATYFVVYTHQLIAMSTSGIVNVAVESLLCGFLLHICCQFEILEYRLTKLTHDQNSLRDCVCHHNQIFEYAYTVNNMFAKIIAIQFAVSMLVLCSNLYRIAMATDYVSFIPLIMYTSAILVQIFIYCWFGNEVKLKSLQLMNSIYHIEWPALSNSNKKDLLLMMRRAMTPIEFTSSYIITMNIESFVALLKMSYSVFNLLHQTNE